MTCPTPVPDAAQQALMLTTWTATGVTTDNTVGKVGMFGTNDAYYFYMKFNANSSDAWWDAAVANKTFRMMFQMGNTLSDWTGVEKIITVPGYTSFPTIVPLDKISVTNTVYTSGVTEINAKKRDNSTFLGCIELSGTGTTGSSSDVTILRLIEREE